MNKVKQGQATCLTLGDLMPSLFKTDVLCWTVYVPCSTSSISHYNTCTHQTAPIILQSSKDLQAGIRTPDVSFHWCSGVMPKSETINSQDCL